MDTYTLVALLTLLVTIFGWYVTYDRQREILNIQIMAEKEKSFLLPKKIKQLDEIHDWAKEGFEIAYSYISAYGGVSSFVNKYFQTYDEEEVSLKDTITTEERERIINKLTNFEER